MRQVLAIALEFGLGREWPLGAEVAVELGREHDAESLRTVLREQPLDAGIAFLARPAPVRGELEQRHGAGHGMRRVGRSVEPPRRGDRRAAVPTSA